MGNHRFKLSEMMSNTWFHKLKGLNTKTHKIDPKKNSPFPQSQEHHDHHHHHRHHKTEHHHSPSAAEADLDLSHSRKSYYVTREFVTKPHSDDPPRKSSRIKGHTKRNPVTKPPNRISAATRCRTAATLFRSHHLPIPVASPDHHDNPQLISNDIPLPSKGRVPCSASCRRRAKPLLPDEEDVIVAVDVKSLYKNRGTSKVGLGPISGIELAPIIAKSEHFKENRGSVIIDGTRKEQSGSSMRRLSVSSPRGNGVRLRVNSPRIMGSSGGGRRSSFSGSRLRRKHNFSAFVKSSFDPQRDFKESMVEMIVENDIRESKELEDLLACYLTLNSDDYHDLIIKVFKQIWFDIYAKSNAKMQTRKWK